MNHNELVEGQPSEPSIVIPYASAYRRARVVAGLFAVGILLSLAMLLCNVHRYQLMDRILHNQTVSGEDFELNDSLLISLSFAWLPWYLCTVVAFLMWVHRAHRNLSSLGATGLELTPRGAVGWYFVPFLNLFKPYQAMREIYNASDRGVWLEGASSWRRRNAPVVVKTWWALFLLMNFVSHAVARASTHADTPGAIKFVAAASVVDDIIAIAAMLAATWLVWSVVKRQEIRAHSLGLIY